MKSSKSPGNFLLIAFTIIVVSLACNLPGEDASSSLSLSPPAGDGSVSGSYTIGDQKMLFSVTADGFATYHIEGAPESEWLAVSLNDDQTAIISWKGILLDGHGPLTDEEQTALDELMRGELAPGLEMIPLDTGCQGGDQIDPRQVAALLVPLQLRFKYQITARSAEALELMALSECGYGSWEEGRAEKMSVVQLSPSSPVPAVFGYFPLDEAGGVDPPASSLQGGHTACLPASTDGSILLGARPVNIDGTGIVPFGPCNARCRGACGSDCEPNNCTEKEELRCEVDEGGQKTGMEVKYKIYECGIHQACIDHDACYDDCNFEYGCDTWGASFCMRGLCDAETVAIHGVSMGTIWAYGFGSQPEQDSYEYLDESFEKQLNLEKCPAAAEASSAGEGDGQVDQEGVENEGETSIPTGTYKGIMTDTELATGGMLGEWKVQGTVESNEIIIIIAEDGSVTGSFSYIKKGNIALSDESHGVTCTSSNDHFYVGEPTGQLTNITGRIVFEIKRTVVGYLSEGCSTGATERSTETDIKQHFEIEIKDGVMTGRNIVTEDGNLVKGTFRLVKE